MDGESKTYYSIGEVKSEDVGEIMKYPKNFQTHWILLWIPP